MAKGVTVKIDAREFNRTLAKYRTLSKRTLPVICNTKAMFIARNAVLLTPKADKGKIEAEIGKFVRVEGRRRVAIGPARAAKTKALVLSKATKHPSAPLAALIINKRRGKGHGLYGAEMAEAVRRMVAGRMRSIAFLKSGWLPAIKALLPFSDKKGAPKQDRSTKTYGVPKGSAKPAKPGFWNVQAEINNTASENTPFSVRGKNGLARIGGPALQQAFDMEERSMRQYIENKLRGAAKKAGIKTN